MDDDDWEHERRDYESAGETFVSGAWIGHAAYAGRGELVPSRFAEVIQLKVGHLEVLLGLLKVFAQDRPLDAAEREFWAPRAKAAIAKAEAILGGIDDPEDPSTHAVSYVVGRVINRFGEMDYLCAWDAKWGTTASALANAFLFQLLPRPNSPAPGLGRSFRPFSTVGQSNIAQCRPHRARASDLDVKFSNGPQVTESAVPQFPTRWPITKDECDALDRVFGPLPMPRAPDASYYPSEDALERAIERLVDRADALFLAGRATQEQYDAWMGELNRWSETKRNASASRFRPGGASRR